MKNNMRKALAISGMALAIGTSGFIIDASANSGSARIQRSHQERIVKTRRMENLSGAKHGRRTIVGTVSAIDGTTLTITKGSKTFTVNTNANTRILNKQWKAVTFSDIKKDDKIRVFGTISADVITAKTVRDISLQ
jgi:hypothetical protein